MFQKKHHMIMDIVHGGVQLNPDEVRVIDHPLFQRLRYISQNDVLSMVFPGATHSRFEHSIGACHMSGRFFDSIAGKGIVRAESAESIKALRYLRECLRLAVLLHDIGHGAFSHQLERSPTIKSIMTSPGHFKALWSKVGDYTQLYQSEPQHVEHEHYSVCMSYKLLHDLEAVKSLSVEPLDIMAIMETTEDVALSQTFIKSAEAAWSHLVCNTKARPCARFMAMRVRLLLRGLLTNELDADKADYMLRDGQYSSVSYGNYNIDTLIDNVGCAFMPDEGWMGLVLVRKGLSAFEDFTYSRFQLYRQIYSHKTSVMFDLILQQSIDELMSVKAINARVTGALQDPSAFLRLNDHYFWEAFRDYADLHPESYCAMLVNRRKLKGVGRFENMPDFQIEAKRRELAEDFGVPISRVFQYTSKAKFTAIDHQFNKIRVACRTEMGLVIRSVAEETNFFNRFENITITNFYIRWP